MKQYISLLSGRNRAAGNGHAGLPLALFTVVLGSRRSSIMKVVGGWERCPSANRLHSNGKDADTCYGTFGKLEAYLRSAEGMARILRVSQFYLHTHAFICDRYEPCLCSKPKLVLILLTPE